MASNNYKEMESLKERCAVRNNPFFLSQSKGSAFRIPQFKSATKENINPIDQEKINQSFLNASDLSFFRESNRKRPTITAHTFSQPRTTYNPIIDTVKDSANIQDGDAHPLIDLDETCSQDTVVEVVNSDHELSDHELIGEDIVQRGDSVVYNEESEAISYTNPDDYKITKITSEMSQIAPESHEYSLLDDLPEMIDEGNAFLIETKLDQNIPLIGNRISTGIDNYEENDTNVKDDSVQDHNISFAVDKNTDNNDVDEIRPIDSGCIQHNNNSLLSSPQLHTSSFQLPEWQNQDFSELWGFIGDGKDVQTSRNIPSSNYLNEKDDLLNLDLQQMKEVFERITEPQDLYMQDEPNTIETEVEYKKLEPVSFHLNLVTSNSIDGLSKMASELEELQKDPSIKGDRSSASTENIQYLSVKNVLLESKTVPTSTCMDIKKPLSEEKKLIKEKSEQEAIPNVSELTNIVNTGSENTRADHINTKLSIFDQKTQVIVSKIDDLPSSNSDISLLKSNIETKRRIVDTGKFEKREESKFVQQPKNEVCSIHDSPILNHSNSLKKVTFGAAWKGELETVKYVHHDNGNSSYFPGAEGILIFEVNELSNLSSSRSDRNYQIEVHHQYQKEVSQLVFLPETQTKTYVGFESKLSLNGISEIEFKLVQVREEKIGVKQSIINLFSTIGRKKGKSISSSLSLYNMKDSNGGLERKNSILSLNSISQTFHTIGSAKLDSSIICSSKCEIKTDIMNLKIDKKNIGKMSLRYIYIPYYSRPNLRDSILPSSLGQVEHTFTLLALHNKVYKKGYMYQLGGDTTKWTKRFYELLGMQLYIFSSKGSKVLDKLDLTQLWTAQILCKPIHIDYKNRKLQLEIIELEFKDGVIISLGTKSSDKGDRDEWMRSMEEVDKKLSGDPIPEWINA